MQHKFHQKREKKMNIFFFRWCVKWPHEWKIRWNEYLRICLHSKKKKKLKKVVNELKRKRQKETRKKNRKNANFAMK